MKALKYIISAIAVFTVVGLKAQEATLPSTHIYYLNKARKSSSSINWLPEENPGQRYTIAIRPFYLINNGLKVDFEFELKHPGQWIQIEGVLRYTGWYNGPSNDGYYYGNSGWDTIESSRNFNKLNGGGGAVSYKYMFTPNGWYFNTGVSFNYYDLHYKGQVFCPDDKDGNPIYTTGNGMLRAQYYKPAMFFNVGKHFSLGRRVFLDAFVGMGYTYSYGNTNAVDKNVVAFDEGAFYSDSPYSLGYSGVVITGGFRVGWLLGGTK